MDDDDEEAINCKVVILGEAGVGKTSIITRFVNDTFDNEIRSSTGVSYTGKKMKFKDFKNKVINFEIWDTAGQEIYRSLNKNMYTDAAIALLIYDITNENSFTEIQNYWYQQLKENAPKDISKF